MTNQNSQQPVDYKPVAERTIDYQYYNLLKKIMETGKEVPVIHGGNSRKIVGYELRYDMTNGFPVLTERFLAGNYFKGALGEHIGFLHGAHTHEELTAFGCPWWKKWTDEEKSAKFNLPVGELGAGSYGISWTNFPTDDGRRFNQILNFQNQVKTMPFLRTHFLSPWIPDAVAAGNLEFPRRTQVAPCHGWIHAHVDPKEKTVVLMHFQRSADVPVGLCFNIMQYAAFGMMLAHMMGYKFTELVHYISDAHIYEMQYPHVEELLSREPKRFGTVVIDEEPKDILDFLPPHFELQDYDSWPKMDIPTPI